MSKRAVFVAALCGAIVLPWNVHAQRRRQEASAGKPAVDIVQSIGCVERTAGSPPTWWLSKAADARVTPTGFFNATEVAEAKGLALGQGRFQLIGVADFLDAEGLLQQGKRSEFTTRETANATAQLIEGHKVVVKGLLIEVGTEKRINLMTVVSIADSCS